MILGEAPLSAYFSGDSLVLTAACRSPMGAFGSDLGRLAPAALAAGLLRRLREKTPGLAKEAGSVVLGSLAATGHGAEPARLAAILAGQRETPARLVAAGLDSGLQAVLQGAESVIAGGVSWAMAGGVDVASRCPYLLPRHGIGGGVGPARLEDSLLRDSYEYWALAMTGLPEAETDWAAAGQLAEALAHRLAIGRAEQDAWARHSHQRCRQAIKAGAFKAEIAGVLLDRGRFGSLEIETDEPPFKQFPERIADYPPAYSVDGCITAGNTAPPCDGTAAVVVMAGAQAAALGLEPLAALRGWRTVAGPNHELPRLMREGIEGLLAGVDWRPQDLAWIEASESFALFPLILQRELGLDPQRINPWGGALSLGDPLGAAGARQLVTAIHGLQASGGGRGLVVCLGLTGTVTALLLEGEKPGGEKPGERR